MADSKRDVTDPQTVHEQTCWQQLLNSQVTVFCKGLAGSRPAMFFNALLALSPVADILSDLLTAASFAYNGHAWWTAITLGIFYLSGRFTVMFMALCPTPSAWNLFCLYLPGCWQLRTLPSDEDDPTKRGFPAPPTHGPAELEGPAPIHGGATTISASNGDAHVPPPSRAVSSAVCLSFCIDDTSFDVGALGFLMLAKKTGNHLGRNKGDFTVLSDSRTSPCALGNLRQAVAQLALSKNRDKADELLHSLHEGLELEQPKADVDQQVLIMAHSCSFPKRVSSFSGGIGCGQGEQPL